MHFCPHRLLRPDYTINVVSRGVLINFLKLFRRCPGSKPRCQQSGSSRCECSHLCVWSSFVDFHWINIRKMCVLRLEKCSPVRWWFDLWLRAPYGNLWVPWPEWRKALRYTSQPDWTPRSSFTTAIEVDKSTINCSSIDSFPWNILK